MIDLREGGGKVSFSVRVQPRASRSEILGEWQGALRVRLAAPPVDDHANEALRRLLAERLKLPVSAVTLLRGQRSRTKHIEILGATAAQVRALAVVKGTE
jgi:uncharacterized protein (TIGR00251 family)